MNEQLDFLSFLILFLGFNPILTFVLVTPILSILVGNYFKYGYSWRCVFGFHNTKGHYHQTHGMTLNPNGRGVTGHTSCVRHCSRCGIRTYLQGE